MGRYFNENFKHAKVWPRRGRDDLRKELAERRRRKTVELTEIPAETGVSKPRKNTGGRPRLNVSLNEVLDNLSKGNTVAQTARAMGISRGAVYRTIHSSPEAMDLWAD